MSMFPGANAIVQRNEAGEPTGWDYPSDGSAFDCGMCGSNHDEYDCNAYDDGNDDAAEDEEPDTFLKADDEDDGIEPYLPVSFSDR